MTATMTDDKATTETPKIITVDEYIAQAKACIDHPQWAVIKGWVREEILITEKNLTVSAHLPRALVIAQKVLQEETDKVTFAARREELIARAERCTNSPFWKSLSVGFKTRLLVRVEGGRFGARDVSDVIQALDVLEGVLERMQNRASMTNEHTLDRMGYTGDG